MIAQIHHDLVPTENADDFKSFLNKQVLAEYGASEGNRGVYFLEERNGKETCFVTLSFWLDDEALEKYLRSPFKGAERTAAGSMPDVIFRIVGKSWW